MGNDLRTRRKPAGNSGGRNNAPNKGRLDALKKSRGQFDIAGVDSARLLTSVGLAIGAGGALRIGLTRDGGALAVGVYIDGASETIYLNEDDDQNEFWDSIDSVFS